MPDPYSCVFQTSLILLVLEFLVDLHKLAHILVVVFQLLVPEVFRVSGLEGCLDQNYVDIVPLLELMEGSRVVMADEEGRSGCQSVGLETDLSNVLFYRHLRRFLIEVGIEDDASVNFFKHFGDDLTPRVGQPDEDYTQYFDVCSDLANGSLAVGAVH